MTLEGLRAEVALELRVIEATVRELVSLQHDLADRQPTAREKAATAVFLAQFYSGVENILKRISRYYGVPLPVGETWHVDLFRRFCVPPYSPLPALFDDALAAELAPFRRFRHVVYHGYSQDLDWDRMQEGVAGVGGVFERFRSRLEGYLEGMG